MSTGKWRLSRGDRRLHYSHASVSDNYTHRVPSVAMLVIPYLTLSYRMKIDLQKVTEMDGDTQRDGDRAEKRLCLMVSTVRNSEAVVLNIS